MKRVFWIIIAVSAILVGLKLGGWIGLSWMMVLLPAIVGAVVLVLMFAVLIGVAVGFGAAIDPHS
jgi:hypothetical protein